VSSNRLVFVGGRALEDLASRCCTNCGGLFLPLSLTRFAEVPNKVWRALHNIVLLIVWRSVLNRVPKQYGTNIVGYSAHNAYVAFDTRLLKFCVRFCQFRCGMSILPILSLYRLKSSHNIPTSLHPTLGVSVIFDCWEKSCPPCRAWYLSTMIDFKKGIRGTQYKWV